MDASNLENLVESVVTTFKFHGVSITGFDLDEEGVPSFSVIISEKKRRKSLEDTLNFVYWTLWSLVYGKHEESSTERIILNYKEVE